MRIAGLTLAATLTAHGAAGYRTHQADRIGPGTAAGGDATVYSVFSGPKRAGALTISRSTERDWRVQLMMDASMPGPQLDARVRFDHDQVPISVDLTGLDSSKHTVSDHFVLQGGRAEWTSGIDRGQRLMSGEAYYLTAPIVEQQMSAIPAEVAWLARALLSSPRHSLPLLPFGEASIEKIQTIEVRSGEGRRSVTEYAVRGLDFDPVPVWLDDHHELFAVTGVEWVATIREGWEDVLATLRRAQQEAASQATALTARLAEHPRGPVVFRHVGLFDAEAGELRPNMTVVVSGDRIRAVGRAATTALPRGARVIECEGMTLLPGLWDMHTHVGPNDGVLHLAFGVTSARDMGNYVRRAMDLRQEFDHGIRIGPRLFLAGLIDGRGPYQAPTEVFVDTEQEARDAVEWFARLGYLQIKLYGSIKPELVPLIARLAHERNMRVSGHIPAHMTASQAVQDGFDEVNHTNYLFLNFMPDVTEIQTQARITAPADRAPDLDLRSATTTAFFDLLKEHHTAIDPTLNIYETRYTARKGRVDSALASVETLLPYRRRRNAYAGGIDVPPGKDARYRDSFQSFLSMVGELHRSGVTTLVGSDGLPGLGFARELELDVRAGIPARKVLQLATLGSARVLGQGDDLGSIARGKLADLVVVAGNPVERIGDVRNTRWVMRGGTLYSGEALRRACGLAPAHP